MVDLGGEDFRKRLGSLFGGGVPRKKDFNMLGSRFGPPILGNYQIVPTLLVASVSFFAMFLPIWFSFIGYFHRHVSHCLNS